MIAFLLTLSLSALYLTGCGANAAEAVANFTAQGYANWQEPTISALKATDGTLAIGVRIKCNAKGRGTIDDFTLNKLD